MTTDTDIPFELKYRREAYKTVQGKMVRDTAKDAELPDTPPQFHACFGSYQHVSREAVRLNEVQLRSGFLHYLFFPEPA